MWLTYKQKSVDARGEIGSLKRPGAGTLPAIPACTRMGCKKGCAVS